MTRPTTGASSLGLCFPRRGAPNPKPPLPSLNYLMFYNPSFSHPATVSRSPPFFPLKFTITVLSTPDFLLFLRRSVFGPLLVKSVLSVFQNSRSSNRVSSSILLRSHRLRLSRSPSRYHWLYPDPSGRHVTRRNFYNSPLRTGLSTKCYQDQRHIPHVTSPSLPPVDRSIRTLRHRPLTLT